MVYNKSLKINLLKLLFQIEAYCLAGVCSLCCDHEYLLLQTIVNKFILHFAVLNSLFIISIICLQFTFCNLQFTFAILLVCNKFSVGLVIYVVLGEPYENLWVLVHPLTLRIHENRIHFTSYNEVKKYLEFWFYYTHTEETNFSFFDSVI